MMVFINPQNETFTINPEDIVDANKNVVDNVTIVDLDEKRKTVTIEGCDSLTLSEGMYFGAKENNQYLKFDPDNSSRVRRIDVNKIKDVVNVTTAEVAAAFDPTTINITPTLLKDIDWDPKLFQPYKTGTYLDGFVSRKGGFLPGTNIMVTGDPGIGKSSNMMEILTKVKENNPDLKVAYVSAEMEEEDLQEFLQFYPGLDEIPFLILGNYMFEDDGLPVWQVLSAFLSPGYDIVVFDSLIEIQTIVQEELGLSQKKGEAWMLKLMRGHNKGYNQRKSYTCFLNIQQKNKSGQYVGSKRLEHMTTAFLQLLWDTQEKGKRYMVFAKNRKGKEKVKLYYSFGNGTDSIQYDVKRHTIELDILERLQNGGDDLIEDMKPEDFEALFNEDPKED